VSAGGGAFAYFSHGSDSHLPSIVPDATALPTERGPLFAPFNPTPDPVVPDPPHPAPPSVPPLSSSTPATGESSSEEFPPYGKMAQFYYDYLARAASTSAIERVWPTIEDFEAEIRVLKEDFISPIIPRDADGVRAELDVMAAESPALREELIPYARGDQCSGTHEEVFEVEDGMCSRGDTPGFAACLTELLEAYGEEWQREFNKAIDLCGVVVLRLKDAIQRARPYQTARILGHNLQPLLALSSQTPSLPSGHALQSYCAAASIVEHIVNRSLLSEPSFMTDLLRISNHLGDRRVIAGVHYPSDSYASAIVFSKIVERAWPAAKELGVRFGRNASERVEICGTDELLCRNPTLGNQSS